MRAFLRRLFGFLLLALGAAIWFAPLDPWQTWVVGGGSLLVGLALVAGLYAARGAIRVSPVWVAATGDLIFLLFAGAVVFMALDAAEEHWFGYTARLDGGFQFVGVLGVLAGCPIFAFVLTLLTGQSLTVDGRGVTSYGLFGRQELSWEDLKGVRIAEQQMVTAKAGAVLPRKLQRTLVLEGSSDTIEISEPQVDAVKAEIASALQKNAPESWQEALAEKIAEWY